MPSSQMNISQDYRAAAITFPIANDVSYLDKFAVEHDYQSSGLGNRLWEMLTKHHPKL